MVTKGKNLNELKLKRKKRVRRRVSGTESRPRISLFRSAKHIYAQVIDDVKGHTLVSVSTMQNRESIKDASPKDTCKSLGGELGKKCLQQNIKMVAFDKNGNKYHGRVKAFAEGAREAGLSF